MASKSAYLNTEKGAEVEEQLETFEKALDRLRVLFEQYFMGMQKQAPMHLHTDAERRLRDLTQLQIRNTAQRYRLATVTQKFSSYNTYWKRTLREIEQGRYVRNLAKLRRQAAAGLDLPAEILAAMPARMRDQVRRDREQALARANRRQGVDQGDAAIAEDRAPAHSARQPGNVHRLDADDDLDMDALFAAVASDDRDGDDERATAGERASASEIVSVGEQVRASEIVSVGERASASERASEREVSSASPPQRPSRPAAEVIPKAADEALPDVDALFAAMSSDDATPTPKPTAAPIPVQPQRGDAQRAPAPTSSSAAPTAAPLSASPPPSASAADATPAANATPATPRAKVAPVTPPVKIAPIMPPAKPIPTPTPSAAASAPAKAALPPLTPPSKTAPLPTIPKAPAKVAPKKPGLPPGMTDADVNTLYAQYAKARELVGQKSDAQTYAQLMRTLHNQAPKIMADHKAPGVEFSVVVKDQQVILKAKPKK